VASEGEGVLILTGSQADCLMVLRYLAFSAGRIAIEAKLDLKRTLGDLRKLEALGLVRHEAKLWAATARGRTCDFEVVPKKPENRGRPHGSSANRLLDLLDRPKRGRALAAELGLTLERVRQLVIKLHAQGRVVLGDPDHPSWVIKRADDESPILSRDEERMLSALPRTHVTDARRLRVAAKAARDDIERILAKLTDAGFAEAVEGTPGGRCFRITEAGLDHPQYLHSVPPAPPPGLPVRSDRNHAVLRAIAESGELRMKDLKDLTKLPPNSMNALIQYLKRKGLVTKTEGQYRAAYRLTERGRATLAEMSLRRAA
jgi:DNA-binding PadR family transcriptional regulator